MAQLTIFKPDNSCAKIILISDSLYNEILTNLDALELDNFNLIFLKEIEERVLSVISSKIEITNLEEIQGMISDSFNWFNELLEVISNIEKLPLSESLIISISE
ncbi:MAG: hypothetical protein QNJ60_07555 [Xenococcaceae cyanobacterium MO_188.B19]|nr:hypothetical protein [Xenococcaceae cyanobacterium MO_188.B19]